jgi:hypothetical protein
VSARPWRQRVLFGTLAVTIVLSAASGKGWQTEDEPAPPPKIPMPRVAKQPAQPLPRIELERLQRQDGPAETGTAAGNAFKAMSWYVPPPPPPPRPPPKPLPPPPPTAPPMPFSFMGRYVEGEILIILLLKGERIYTVSEGEVIDNTYRVERLSGGQLELTYLPLNIKQTISAEESRI